jgi:hypothetical protein
MTNRMKAHVTIAVAVLFASQAQASLPPLAQPSDLRIAPAAETAAPTGIVLEARRGRGADDAPGHKRRGRGADDGPNHT